MLLSFSHTVIVPPLHVASIYQAVVVDMQFVTEGDESRGGRIVRERTLPFSDGVLGLSAVGVTSLSDRRVLGMTKASPCLRTRVV